MEEHKKAETEWASTRENLDQQIRAHLEQQAILEKQNETLATKLQSLSSQVMSKVATPAPASPDKDSSSTKGTGEPHDTPTGGKGRQVTRGYSLRSAGHKSGDPEDPGATPVSGAVGVQEKKKEGAGTTTEAATAVGGEENKEKPPSDEAMQTPEQMLNVNRFLRREKEIAETRVEILQAEVSRLKQQNEYVEKQMNQAHKTLAAERQRATVSEDIDITCFVSVTDSIVYYHVLLTITICLQSILIFTLPRFT